MSKFSPTIGDIGTYRGGNESRRSIGHKNYANENTSQNEQKLPCLMKQIGQSRKDLF